MNNKSVMIVIGSPRKNGNSAALALRAAAGARKAGAEVRVFRLHEMDIKPCRACDWCRRKKKFSCVIEDDMREVYPALRRAVGLAIASPIYWFTVSAQTKLFMDRLYAFVGPKGHGLKGKRIGIMLAYADEDPFISGAANALRTLQDCFRYVGAPIEGMVYGSAGPAGQIAENRELMRDAFALGARLAAGGKGAGI
jgi:multimeric flavodoxin WrbA